MLLHHVHPRVGKPHQIGNTAHIIRVKGDSATDSQRGSAPLEFDTAFDSTQQARREGIDLIPRSGAFDEQNELVPSYTRQTDVFTHRFSKPLAYYAQRFIATFVPQRIVDALKAIDVAIDEGDMPAVLKGAALGLFEALARNSNGSNCVKRSPAV